jgi:hypothetical protein
VLFDALGSKRPNLTMEDFSSDHAAILQRVYNFLCSVIGNDPRQLDSLITNGYIPEPRRLLWRRRLTSLRSPSLELKASHARPSKPWNEFHVAQ